MSVTIGNIISYYDQGHGLVCMYVLYDANVGNRGYMNQEGSVYMFLSL